MDDAEALSEARRDADRMHPKQELPVMAYGPCAVIEFEDPDGTCWIVGAIVGETLAKKGDPDIERPWDGTPLTAKGFKVMLP